MGLLERAYILLGFLSIGLSYGQSGEETMRVAVDILLEKAKEQPVLLVHGTVDDRIAIDYAYTNFNQLKNENKTLLEIEGTDHLTVWQKGENAYFLKVFTFLDNLYL